MSIFDIFIILLTFLISWFILKACYKKSYGTYLNIYYVAYYMVQLAIACVILLFDDDFLLWNDYGTMLKSAIVPFSFSILIANIGILIGNSFANKLFHLKHNISLDKQLEVLVLNYNAHHVSLFFLVVFSFSIITSLNVSYIIAVFALTFSFCPVFVGFLWRSLSRFDKCLWILALSTNMAFHILQGSRGSALFPIIFAFIGYLISIKSYVRLFKRRVLAFGIVAVLSMPLLSFVSAFREFYGRGLDVSWETVVQMVDFAKKGSIVVEADNGINQSLGRMLIHANVATPYLTPKPVPYRGWDSFTEELNSIVSLKGESGRDQNRLERGDMGYGTGVATRYGFHVTEYTSVEWPIFADGFSRFGYIGLFLYSALFALFLSWIERKCKNLWNTNGLLSLVMHLFIIYNGALSYMYSYYAFMKLLVFRLPLVIITIYIFSKFVKKTNISYK